MLARSLALAALVASAAAYQINKPDNTTDWSSSASTQSVEYVSVSSDASSFAVILVQDSAQVAILEQNVTKQDAATLSLAAPSGGWPTGDGFQVNFVRSTQESSSILAQSGRFAISNNGAASASSSSSSAASSTSSAANSASSASSAAASLTSGAAGAVSSTAGDASGGIPNASAAPSSAASALGSSNALIAAVLAAVGYLAGL